MKFQWPAVQYALFALTAGCVTAHSPDDASEVDAALARDASSTVDAFRLPDAFVPPDAFCPDSDRDGERDVRCGGTDCDDADAQVSSTRTHCASPTSVTRCEGAMRVDAACEGATPYCDARTNGCVADACGDRVVHSNEQCDDGRDMSSFACDECRHTCRFTSACDPGMVCRPYMSREVGARVSGCFSENVGGASFASRCTTDGECLSGLCSPSDARCTETAFAEPTPPCSGPHRWSEHVPIARTGEGGRVDPDSVCAFECEHDSECAADATCIPMALNIGGGETYFVAGCRLDWARGTGAQGDACTGEHDCASGVCVFGRCSRLCRDASDCDVGAPNCVATDRSMPPPESSDFWSGTARPAEWGTPFPRVCLR